MSDSVEQPWWYSGDEPDASAGGPSVGGTSLDWQGLLTGAARMVDWAASTVVEPHADHLDPAEHPECLVCRTLALVQDRTGMTAPTPQSPVPSPAPNPAPPIRWIPIEDDAVPIEDDAVLFACDASQTGDDASQTGDDAAG